MNRNRDECKEFRREALARHLAAGKRGVDPAATAAHAAGCPGCREFAGRLAGQASPFPDKELYTAALRARTLRAMRGNALRRKSRFMLALGPAVLGNLTISVVFPLWLAHRLFAGWTADPAVSLFLALSACYLAGLTAAMATLVPLAGRMGPRSANPAR